MRGNRCDDMGVARFHPLDLRKALLLINSLLDILEQDERALLRLATLRDHDEDTNHHSVNVAILSLLIGKEAGMAGACSR